MDEGSEQQLESLERAVQEVEALESIYGYSPGGFTVHSEAELKMSRQATAEGVAAGTAGGLPAEWTAPRLEIELQLEVELLDMDGVDAEHIVCRMRCGLPPGYPATAAASVSVSAEGLKRSKGDELTGLLQAKADALVGEEAVMELMQELQEAAPAIVAEERASIAAAATTVGSGPRQLGPPRLGRRWIVSHHLKNPTKRSNIVAWARDLELGGFSKPGYPGVIVVEGDAVACDEYWLRLRKETGNWKNLALRGEINTDVRPATDDATDTAAVIALEGMRAFPKEFKVPTPFESANRVNH